MVQGAGKPGATEVQDAAWIQRRTVGNKPLVHALRQDLDAGEAEAIALAMEMNADLLLMDERMGRITAHHFGLRYTGLVGLLVVAKQRGLLAEVKPHLDMLRNVIGFRVAEELYHRVLEDVGEI